MLSSNKNILRVLNRDGTRAPRGTGATADTLLTSPSFDEVLTSTYSRSPFNLTGRLVLQWLEASHAELDKQITYSEMLGVENIDGIVRISWRL